VNIPQLGILHQMSCEGQGVAKPSDLWRCALEKYFFFYYKKKKQTSWDATDKQEWPWATSNGTGKHPAKRRTRVLQSSDCITIPAVKMFNVPLILKLKQENCMFYPHTVPISSAWFPTTNSDELQNSKPFKTKRNLIYIRSQSVPRCKHFPLRL
jgi:hypothetical protein